jgi:hypothetical protein
VPRRPLILVCVTALVVTGVAVVLLRHRGGERPAAVADPLAEALAFAPASADVVADLDVAPGSRQRAALEGLARTFPAARFAAQNIRGTVAALGLDPDADLPALLGGPLVLAGPPAATIALRASLQGVRLDLGPLLRTGAIAAIAGHDAVGVAAVFRRACDSRRLRRLADAGPGVAQYALPGGTGRVGVRGVDIVLAGSEARLREAFALRDRGGGLTRATYLRRLGPLSGPALVRLVAQPRVLIGDAARGVPFVDALRGGALAVRLERPGVRVRAHLTTDPARLRPADLPLAPGPVAPDPAPGRAPMDAGVRGLDQTIRVLDAAHGALKVPFLAPVTSALATLDQIRGPLKTFGRIDVDAALIDQLTGTTTITREAHGIAIRAQLNDGGPLRTALNRIAAIPDVAISLAHVTDLDLDRLGDEAYVVRRKGTAILHLAVLGTTLVVTTDLTAGLRAIAHRASRRAPGPGALALHAEGRAVQDFIVTRLGLPDLARLVLGGFGDLDVAARADLRGVDVEATLALDS